MTWTTFAALGVGPGTTPQLDANFATLSGLTPIPCTVVGTNTLVLTSTAGAAALSAYANYMSFVGVAVATNSGAVTAAVTGIAGTLPVYKDTGSGPVALTGGEIVQNCLFTLYYDVALNSGAGGLHLHGGDVSLVGQTINVGGLSILGNNPLTRLNSTLATLTLGTIGPGGAISASVNLAGVQLQDSIALGMPANFLTASVTYLGFVIAAGTVSLLACNVTTNHTITSQTLAVRFTALGFAT